jgi:hypothetical protein
MSDAFRALGHRMLETDGSTDERRGPKQDVAPRALGPDW